ncbi:hypothetical protein Pcinc_036174 [Petrolisthes cinctipes]|uniref:Endonuclease/exonuclease/phosphatase domain-containing protein n=1 Tax=Petrolisthes cinctipes TaxID=88211 RepID=A0AAE1BW79_PETCI|nr:hypothetical protein Pcinc_036174 [Petrolisthes cinctipes]
MYRTDRRDRSHGGVALYVTDNLAINSEIVRSYSNGTYDILAVCIEKINLMVIVAYRPPNTTQELFVEVADKITLIQKHLPVPDTEVLNLGDFNFPHVNWEILSLEGGTAEEKQQARLLTTIVEVKHLVQFVTKPTRGDNILDLIFSNNCGLMHNYDLFETPISDHRICEATVTVNALLNKPPLHKSEESEGLARLNFHHKDINWAEIKNKLKIDWETLLGDENAEKMVSTFTKICEQVCEVYVPQ